MKTSATRSMQCTASIYERFNHLISKSRSAQDFNQASLSKTIKSFRQMKDLAAVDVAKKAGLDPRTFAAIESGRIMNPSLAKLRVIAEAFGVSLGDLFLQADAEQEENFYQGDQKGKYALEFQEDGFKAVSYIPMIPDFFIGKVTLSGKSFLNAGNFPFAGRIFIQIMLGKLKLTVIRKEFIIKEGGHLLFNGKLPHTFQNPLLKECSFLLFSVPSFVAFSPRS